MGARIDALKSGRWRVRLTGNGPKPKDTFEYRWQAQLWAETHDRGAHPAAPAGTDGKPVGWTLRLHSADWLARRTTQTEATIKAYRYQLGRIGESRLGIFDVAEIKRPDVERWLADERAAGTGAPTINRRLKLLRMVMSDAVFCGLASTDPTHGLKFLSTDVREGVRLDVFDQAALLTATEHDVPLRAMCALGLYAGLRWSEVAGLDPSCFDGEYVIVRRALERETGKLRDYPKSSAKRSGRRERVVPLPARSVDMIAPVLAEARVHGWHSLLFTRRGPAGKPLDYHNWRARRFAPAVVASKVDREGQRSVGFHDLRHTYGSSLAAAGVPVKEIATLMGHSSLEVTQRYIHEGDDGRRRDMVAGVFGA